MLADEDRARASAMYGSWFGGDEMDDEIIGDIAAALAAEREKAREPFRGLGRSYWEIARDIPDGDLLKDMYEGMSADLELMCEDAEP